LDYSPAGAARSKMLDSPRTIERLPKMPLTIVPAAMGWTKVKAAMALTMAVVNCMFAVVRWLLKAERVRSVGGGLK
jgi:hypothetical protein